jgi:hypothetical protein
MADYADPVREALRRAGCRFDRHGKGDHEIWLCTKSSPMSAPAGRWSGRT